MTEGVSFVALMQEAVVGCAGGRAWKIAQRRCQGVQRSDESELVSVTQWHVSMLACTDTF